MADQPELPAATPDLSAENRPSGVSLPRRHITAERQAQANAPALEAQLADLTDTVRALAQHVTGDAIAEPEHAPDRAGRRVKKFTRSGATEEPTLPTPLADNVPSLPPPPREARRTDAAEFNKNVAWPREGQAEAAEALAGTPPRRNRRKKKVALVGIMGLAVALLVVGYLVGRSDAPAASTDTEASLPKTVAPAGSGTAYKISERDLDAVNTALRLAKTGDKAATLKFFDQAIDEHLAVPGLQYQAALLALEANDLVTADIHLDRSTNANEHVAACCYIRARFAARLGKYSDVVRQFQAAAHAEPFNGSAFFYWAEALRRAGRPLEAVDILEQARLRSRTTDEDALYLFKERLVKAQSGSDQAFNGELGEHLKEQPVQGDWLMLAAAHSLDAGDRAQAAEFLRQAANALSASAYNLWVKDFLFQSALDDPTLTALLHRPALPDSSELPGFSLDPTVGPPELMDPAIWPVGVAAK